MAQNEASQMNPIVPRAGAPASFAELTQQLAPAVVNISTRQKVQVSSANPFAGTPFADLFGGGGGNGEEQGPQTREAQSLGSGFIISADGYVVTNNHVITADGQGEIETITVTMPDGTDYPAKLIGRDAASDLAVLKVSAPRQLPFVKFGDSRQARVGDWVIAIGNPFGLGGTVTSGIISSVYRNTGQGGAYDRYLQTDAAINRGNSGGPMFDMKGNVIGINNAIFSPTGGSVGIGFAIPAEIASPIIDKLRAGKAIERGYLGVGIQPLNDDLAASLGGAEQAHGFLLGPVGGGPEGGGLAGGEAQQEGDALGDRRIGSGQAGGQLGIGFDQAADLADLAGRRRLVGVVQPGLVDRLLELGQAAGLSGPLRRSFSNRSAPTAAEIQLAAVRLLAVPTMFSARRTRAWASARAPSRPAR